MRLLFIIGKSAESVHMDPTVIFKVFNMTESVLKNFWGQNIYHPLRVIDFHMRFAKLGEKVSYGRNVSILFNTLSKHRKNNDTSKVSILSSPKRNPTKPRTEITSRSIFEL